MHGYLYSKTLVGKSVGVGAVVGSFAEHSLFVAHACPSRTSLVHTILVACGSDESGITHAAIQSLLHSCERS